MTAILQWIYDVFTILTNFIVLISPYAIADVLLKICNLFSIVFIMMVAYVLYDCLASKTKNPVIQTSYFAVLVTIMISAFLSLMLLLEVPFLPQITPSSATASIHESATKSQSNGSIHQLERKTNNDLRISL